MRRFAYILAALVTLSSVPAMGATGADPGPPLDNACVAPGGRGEPCNSSQDCSANAYATICVQHDDSDAGSRRCEIPCEEDVQGGVERRPGRCALGETCVGGRALPSRPASYCRPSQFRMDLNTLHQCIEHFLTGTVPSLGGRPGGDNACSLENNLSQLLDQNADGGFDIFDVDLCVKAFMEQPRCEAAEGGAAGGGWECEQPDLVPCGDDVECGDGLYCDAERQVCQRECGLIASRELSFSVLERQCNGAFQVCDYARGRCELTGLRDLTCEVDRDCPPGAYCLLGSCAPQCYRALDCPDSRWLCADNNRCRARPHPDSDDAEAFDPQNFAVRFGRAQLDLDAVAVRDFSPLSIMNLKTRREVINNPSVSFGYRAMITYSRKQSVACLKPFVDCSDPDARGPSEDEATCSARQSDCIISPAEEWVRMDSPFGVVSAVGRPGIWVELDDTAASRLSPGRYAATLKLIYDNGDSDTIEVVFNKPTPSGEYVGDLSVYMGDKDNQLTGRRPLNMAMRVLIEDELVRWAELLARNNLSGSEDIFDLTQGQLVRGLLHGNSSIAFTRGGARSAGANEIPFVGIYSPQNGIIRMVGVIDMDAEFCVDEAGNACGHGDPKLKVKNPFGRDVRRQIELFGPFDPATRRYSGIYRERLSGLAAPYDITLEGQFELKQLSPDDSAMPEFGPLLARKLEDGDRARCLSPWESAVSAAAGAPPPPQVCSCANSRTPTAFCGSHDCRLTGLPEVPYLVSPGVSTSCITSGGGLAEQPDDCSLPAGKNYCVCQMRFGRELICGDDAPEPCFGGDPETILLELSGKSRFDDFPACETGPAGRTFPAQDQLLAALDVEIGASCLPEDVSLSQCRSAEVDTDVRARCAQFGSYDDSVFVPYSAAFSSAANFAAYLRKARRGTGNSAAVADKAVFPDMVSFNELIQQGLDTLDEDGDAVQRRALLNVYEYLEPFAKPCVDGDDTTPPICTSGRAARCGLALYQKAIVSSWVPMETVANHPSAGRLPPFCSGNSAVAECVTSAGDHPAVFALLEHNRFWQSYAQGIKFDADSAMADAFYTLYRDAVNPFAAGEAVFYKEERLRFALERYDELVGTFAQPVAAAILHGFPVRNYAMRGENWLENMRVILADRMDAIAEFVDIERRIFMNTDDGNFIFAQHLLQNEFLLQVYLMSLDRHWSGMGGFRHEGRADLAFEKGQEVVNQLNLSRNAIGFLPNEVYFENSAPERRNWHNYRDQLADDLIPAANQEIDTAIAEFQASLADVDSLEDSFLEARIEYDKEVERICGDLAANPCEEAYLYANDYVGNDTSENVAANDLDLSRRANDWIRKCKYAPEGERPSNCDDVSQVSCHDYQDKNGYVPSANRNSCEMLVTEFYNGTNFGLTDGPESASHVINHAPVCRSDAGVVEIDVGFDTLTCNGGEMRDVLQEIAGLELSLKQINGSVETLALQLDARLKWLSESTAAQQEFDNWQNGVDIAKGVISTVKSVVNTYFEVTETFADLADCVLIAGFAFGTDCPGHFAEKAVMAPAQIAKAVVFTVLDAVVLVFDLKQAWEERALALNLRGMEGEFDAFVEARQIDNLIDTYAAVMQQLLSAVVKARSLRHDAQVAASRYNLRVSYLADHLLGREQGNILYSRQKVSQSARTFRRALKAAYKMVAAFAYRYNVSGGERDLLLNRLLMAVTIGDVEAVVLELGQREQEYCGLEALDCDADNNPQVLRFSLRDRLFPNLRDVVDARTGAVLSRGEQFHNIITSPPYLRRRVRATVAVDQIELPFSTSLMALENALGGPQWLLDPLACNHLLSSGDSLGNSGSAGTVAARVVGQRLELSQPFNYELIRGATDYIRSCYAESVQLDIGQVPILQYPIKRHRVGYAPHSLRAQEENPPSFFTRSNPIPACVGGDEVGGRIDASVDCWRYFARDRSLSAPDWKFVVPLIVDGARTENAWISGDGLRDDERPIIEDVILYFRYISRPVSDD